MHRSDRIVGRDDTARGRPAVNSVGAASHTELSRRNVLS
jgi:hypothetical protein